MDDDRTPRLRWRKVREPGCCGRSREGLSPSVLFRYSISGAPPTTWAVSALRLSQPLLPRGAVRVEERSRVRRDARRAVRKGIFRINAPIGLAALVLGHRVIAAEAWPSMRCTALTSNAHGRAGRRVTQAVRRYR